MSFIINDEALKAFRTLTNAELDLFLHLASKMDEDNKIHFPVKDREWMKTEAISTQFYTPEALMAFFKKLTDRGFFSFTEEEDIYLLNPKYVQPVKQ